MFALKKFISPVTTSFVAANPAALDATGNLSFEPVSAGKVEEALIVAMLAFFGLSSVISLLAA
ncbi:hypothetical protein QRD43_15765 [Pelomonas sp. APW6]|uniref:Uncharacterized protein n=1 Tax=Roseateles subflavus TaxID=3053353 RepID=A0ABT7LPE0_9BURK|nr:hypothetical protein [Pelomonas sp. APW6]MDL5033371.1 hypothetical protein [Pelomonas sp. APW6]